MGDHEIEDDAKDAAPDGKYITAEDYQYALTQASIIAVVKFWSLVTEGSNEMSINSAAALMQFGSALARHIASGSPDIIDVLGRIREADSDTGQTTDISFLYMGGPDAAPQGERVDSANGEIPVSAQGKKHGNN